MTVLIIIVLSLIYLFIGSIVSVIYAKIMDVFKQHVTSILSVFFWPIILIALLITVMQGLIVKMYDKIKK